jgi:hypothetical protein
MIERMLLFLYVLASPMGFAQTKPSSNTRTQDVSVPFVGCESDGQVGPRKAPGAKTARVVISADAASRLAYYRSGEGLGILAPRGWYCFGVYGSNGSALYVSPERLTANEVSSTEWNGFTGPAIELRQSIGDTSGRFSVARVIARVFPARKAFVKSVIAEGIELEDLFPFGLYPADKLTYRSQSVVEYETPANEDGLGTDSKLRKDAHPICGVAILVGETPDMVHLAVRLSPEMADLVSPVVKQLEHDAEPSYH